jgi:GH35 family endo-1,4-beta-xylanase
MSLDPGPAAGGAQYEVSIPEGEWTVVGLHMGFSSHANGDSTYIDYVKVLKVEEEIPTTVPEPPYTVGDNLTFNGSLTLSDLGETAPESWTISASEGSVVEVVDDAADGDNRALSFTVSWNGSTNWYENEGVNEPVNVVEGERYRISASIKGDTDARIARVYLGMPESGSYERARGFETPQLQLSTEYQEFSFEHIATAANETNAMRVGIELNNEVNDGGVIIIDDVRVTKLEHEVVEQDPIAQGKEKWLGNIYSSAQAQNFTSYWNQVTPENAGKWGSVEGTRDVMNWGGMDAAYNLAKENGLPFRFHILIWGGQQPDWINDLSTEEQLEEIKEWMDAVAERYPDMEYVEVVNEGSNGHQLPDGQSGEANYIEALGGTGETGHDWIITAFEMARERFPDAKLMINDYGIVGNIGATGSYINIIEDLQERDLIDAIGVQAHAFSTITTAPADLRRSLNMLGETGLPIQATEMDIDGDPNGTQAESDALQLERYQRIFPVFWEHPSVEGVTLWGWRPGLWRDDQEAYILREDGEERPALQWLRAYVDTAQVVGVSNEELGTDLPGQYQLYNNYPNPFNPTTQIKYDIPKSSDVKVSVFDITGRLIQTLVNGQKASGSHTVTFNASSISSGVYFYRIEAGSYVNVKRMMLIK